ncbi:Uncharacterised protein [Legionella pneumophila]|nr:Uncharacterised protein [Legionella pneumophila]
MKNITCSNCGCNSLAFGERKYSPLPGINSGSLNSSLSCFKEELIAGWLTNTFSAAALTLFSLSKASRCSMRFKLIRLKGIAIRSSRQLFSSYISIRNLKVSNMNNSLSRQGVF